MRDRPSRLSTCCAAVARAMGDRDPGALVAHAGGEARRALSMACAIRRDPSPPAGDSGSAPAVHPSWWAEPAAALPDPARAAFVGMLPPEGRRIASAAARGRAGASGAGPDPAWLPGETMRSLLRILRPPAISGPARAPGPEAGSAAMVRCPGEAAAITGMIAAALPQDAPPGMAGDLAAMAAGLAWDADAAEAAALSMPRRTGAAFLVARSRWALILDPAEEGGRAGRGA